MGLSSTDLVGKGKAKEISLIQCGNKGTFTRGSLFLKIIKYLQEYKWTEKIDYQRKIKWLTLICHWMEFFTGGNHSWRLEFSFIATESLEFSNWGSSVNGR